jgi:molecular chaperone GrpE (heat shock protein)
MNQLYFKSLLYGSVVTFILIQSEFISAQGSSAKHGDRYDLVASINKVRLDHQRIDKLKTQVDISKKSKNKKTLKVHREKLALEKKVLKADYKHADEQERKYKENKSEKISNLEAELKASEQNYGAIRNKIKKDLAKKNDFALKKDADDLLKAVQARNEISTQLSMEKSDMIQTVAAVDAAWKKVKQGNERVPEKIDEVSSKGNLTNK